MTDDLPDHTNYSLIKAVDESGNLVTVLADSSGRIVSVMKGDYAGSMKTLAVDAQGRIQAVLTDPEDVFGNPNYIGAGELAARLGSIKSFEKRGEVVLMDSFEDSTFKWEVYISGGASVARSNDSAKTGNYSVKLVTTATGSENARITKYIPVTVYKKLGFEVSFTMQANIYRLYIAVYYYDGTTLWRSYIVYDKQAKELSYLSSAGTLVVFASNVKTQAHDQLFNTCKCVVDMNTKEYVGCFFNDSYYDLTGNSLNPAADTGDPHTEVSLIHAGNGVNYGTIYVDDVIITQNEP